MMELSFILPLTLLPGVALLITSTAARLGQLHDELRDTPQPLKWCGFLEATSAQGADGCDSRTRPKIVFRPSYFPGDRQNYA